MLVLTGRFRSFRLRGGYRLPPAPDSNAVLELAEAAVVSSRPISFPLPSKSDESLEVEEAVVVPSAAFSFSLASDDESLEV
jgi:hypothetical protein